MQPPQSTQGRISTRQTAMMAAWFGLLAFRAERIATQYNAIRSASSIRMPPTHRARILKPPPDAFRNSPHMKINSRAMTTSNGPRNWRVTQQLSAQNFTDSQGRRQQ